MKIEMDLEEFKQYASSVGIKVLNLNETLITVEMSIKELLAEEKESVAQPQLPVSPSNNLFRVYYEGNTYTFNLDEPRTEMNYSLRSAILERSKIKAVKWVRIVTNLGLYDAKMIVDNNWELMISAVGGRVQ